MRVDFVGDTTLPRLGGCLVEENDSTVLIKKNGCKNPQYKHDYPERWLSNRGGGGLLILCWDYLNLLTPNLHFFGNLRRLAFEEGYPVDGKIPPGSAMECGRASQCWLWSQLKNSLIWSTRLGISPNRPPSLKLEMNMWLVAISGIIQLPAFWVGIPWVGVTKWPRGLYNP